MINPFIIDEALINAFKEDNPYMDLTTDLLINQHQMAKALMHAKAEGLICGLFVAERAFKLLDPDAQITWHVEEGQGVKSGDLLMTIVGKANPLLKAERIALNFLQRMSGIATLTQQYVQALEGSKTKLVDTRKTTPNFRVFEKYSVRVGGAFNHRLNLSDAVMIKDNHILAAGGIEPAIKTLKNQLGHTVKIEVEVESIKGVQEALSSGADIIMLDNMSNEMMKEAVDLVKGKAILEASGGITLSRLSSIAHLGVDVISTGVLTHSYQSLDISLNITMK